MYGRVDDGDIPGVVIEKGPAIGPTMDVAVLDTTLEFGNVLEISLEDGILEEARLTT